MAGDRSAEAAAARALAEIARRLREPPVARAHGLAWPLVLSLTSHPPRFATLAPTLAALLLQTVRPDATVLWVGRGLAGALPAEVLALRRLGLEIAETEDLGPYTKIAPALAAHPGAAVLTADDDLHYPATLVEELAAAALAAPGAVVARRAHRMGVAGGRPLPYLAWDLDLAAPERGARVFPTGVMGALYPPGSLHEEAGRAALFRALAPGADDVWLWWMHRLLGGRARKVGGPGRMTLWPGSQGVALMADNLWGGGNDRAVAAMQRRYGLPAA